MATQIYLQEGVHLLLHPVDKPPLDHKAVADGEKKFNIRRNFPKSLGFRFGVDNAV